jgi:anti-sigma-K factor RskA
MIDEERQDLAADYALNELDPYKTGAFEAELARDPELRALTEDVCEAAASLAHDAPILASVRGEAIAPSAPPPAAAPKAPVQSGGVSILPWALAAGFAITTAALWFERDQLRTDSMNLRQEAIALREKAEKSKGRIADLSKEVEVLKNRDALAQVRLATLSAQVDAYKNGKVLIAWDPEKQRGVVQFTNLPRPEAGKDYQLWVIDPKYPKPVSGGVVPTNPDGSANIAFKTVEPIEKADKFAVSVEPAGGVPSATGPIVFLGN